MSVDDEEKLRICILERKMRTRWLANTSETLFLYLILLDSLAREVFHVFGLELTMDRAIAVRLR